jgi:hypothetical protein
MSNENLKAGQELLAKFKKAQNLWIKEAEKILVRNIIDVHADTVRQVQQGARTGRMYKVGKSRYHQASAQGEFPKTNTGQLAALMFFDVIKNADKLETEFGSRAAHAKPLEFKPASKGGRPWLHPQFKKFEPIVLKELAESNRRILEKVFRKKL